jgi:nucleoredoxin
MSSIIDFIGEKLQTENGKSSIETESLDTVPIIALYFSANWCPPCKMFTEKLKSFYKEVNATTKRLEIIWVSGDEEEEEYEEYFEKMPWTAMPFEPENAREDVTEKFDIASIPQLIVLNKDGSVKTSQGKKEVEDNGVSAFESWL